MNYRIESKEAFMVYGIESIMTTNNGENFSAIPQFWLDAIRDGRVEKLAKSTNMGEEAPNYQCLVNAICDYRLVEGDNMFPYMLFAHKTNKSQPEGYKEVTVPTATWAIFKTENHTTAGTSEAIQNLVKRIYTEWLPTTNYEKMDGYELKLYYDNGSTCWSEVWIRVRPENN